MNKELLKEPLSSLVKSRPYMVDFFTALGLTLPRDRRPLEDFLRTIPQSQLAPLSLDHPTLVRQCLEFMTQMELFRQDERESVREVTILGGRNKKGEPEVAQLVLRVGEVVAVVGPTGSGKSRLLADLECLAQGDTPSGRRVLLDGAAVDEQKRLSGEQQLVAQLSQNMNFVMDLSVGAFLRMHAESRLVDDIDERIAQIYATAVELAGEPFTMETPVTSLSGGQSRALMIADVAGLSRSPIVLIDEIENAGVDRRRALELLVRQEKIVLMATHDPLLALSADRRLVIAGGGIKAVLKTSEAEIAQLRELEAIDARLSALRENIRRGGRLDEIVR